MRVIGVDPGSAVTGFGVVERLGGGFRYLAAGTVRTNPRAGRPSRLRTIFEQLNAVIDEHAPEAMSLERSFVGDNVQSAFRLGETRGVAMLAAATRGIDFFEYDPTQVKLAVAAYGRADKTQVKFMVRQTLGLPAEEVLADDASDALALALCHLGRVSIIAAARDGNHSRQKARLR